MAAGVLMLVLAMSVVVVIQWEHVARLMASDPHGGPHGFASAAPTPEPNFDLADLQVPRDKLMRGGPPKDGIPSLTDPEVVPVTDAGFMRDEDRVVGVTLNGESRAYPIKVLNWHECYNDTLGGVPVAVVFCPLCDSVTVVDRRIGDKTLEFGISGLLYNSNVLLYDRQDDALWSQAGLIAVSGPHAGQSLMHLSGWEITSFKAWALAQPASTIATMETGYYAADRYNSVAYESYFQTDAVMFPVEKTDDRFANKQRVIGVVVGDAAKAYPLDAVAATPGSRVEDTLGGRPVILEADDQGGVKIVQLPERAKVIHTFWFAWHVFHPASAVYSPDPDAG